MPDAAGGIQPPAKPGFQDTDINLPFSENQHSHRKKEFKVGGVHQAIRLHPSHTAKDLLKCLCELLFRYHLSADSEAFPDINQMRRGEKACAQSLFSQNTVQVRAHGPLSIRPRHVNHPETVLRMIQTQKQIFRILQSGFFCKPGDLIDIPACFIKGQRFSLVSSESPSAAWILRGVSAF